MKKVFLFVFLFTLIACNHATTKQLNTTVKKSKLIEVFKASNTDYPNISVHRGGKGIEHYPENCLETIEYINNNVTKSVIFEVDVAQTEDGHLILMHDNSIDRTTTGTGVVNRLSYNAIKKFYLVDDYGNATTSRIPLFSEVLAWCKENNVILTVDIKRSVSQEDVINAIRKANAQDICIIITYDVAQAVSAYMMAPELLLSVSARNHDELDRLLKTNIPTENMLAFTGTRLSNTSLYKRLHDKNIVCMLGTLGNLDKQAKAKGDYMYKRWKDIGVDILATDRPFEAYNAIN